MTKPFRQEIVSTADGRDLPAPRKRTFATRGIMLTARRTALLALAAAVLLTGCWNPFSPDSGDGGQDQVYHEFCDSAYKVLENLELAYKSMDLDHYLMCFRDDFEFFLLETDWADYDGDGQTDQSWGLDLEEQFHEVLFEGGEVDQITLTLNIPQGVPYGDGKLFQCDFQLKVYQGEGGYQASGQADFICKQDSTSGEWLIWQWYDYSDT